MLLEINKAVALDRAADAVWEVVRDPVTVAGCIPNVRQFTATDGAQYSASVEDKLGPFKVEVPVTITVSEDVESRRMTADIAGADKRGQARVRGQVTADVVEADGGSRLELRSQIEVLGRLASLGAVPMRRRADQIFDVFVGNLGNLLRNRDIPAGA
jgi:carbon monoxide dehydrogenase subunit G